jgi:hypothetical protein
VTQISSTFRIGILLYRLNTFITFIEREIEEFKICSTKTIVDPSESRSLRKICGDDLAAPEGNLKIEIATTAASLSEGQSKHSRTVRATLKNKKKQKTKANAAPFRSTSGGRSPDRPPGTRP